MPDRKQRINTGIENDKISYGPMLVAEGERQNYLPHNPFASTECKSNVVGANILGTSNHRIFPGIKDVIQLVQVNVGKPFLLELTIECPDELLGYTFSAFIDVKVNTPALFKVSMHDGAEIKNDNFLISNNLTRYEISHEFAVAPKEISVCIEGKIENGTLGSPIEIGFCFLTIENGLFTSSPIASREHIRLRDGVQYSFQRAKNFFERDSGTISFFFSPDWTGPQLGGEQIAYLFDCISSNGDNSVSIIADGADYGRIKAEITVDGNLRTITTDIIPIQGKLYAVALRWAPNIVDLVINGRNLTSIAGLSFPDASALGENVYLGSTERSSRLSAFAGFRELKSYNQWLLDRQIRADIFSTYPNNFPQFETDWRGLATEPSLTLFTNKSWSFQFSLFLLGLQKIWQENPPRWLIGNKIDEAHFRDEIQRYLSMREWEGVPEYQSFEGRTDLLVKSRRSDTDLLRMEFKIWGRHDYKDIPEKPMKYFTDGESLGVVIMINPTKKKLIGEEYRSNVSASDMKCHGIVNKPFEREFFPDHFVSIHVSDRNDYVEILHIVINRQSSFSIKDLDEPL